jgi:hypothetical protein
MTEQKYENTLFVAAFYYLEIQGTLLQNTLHLILAG